jgi:acylglycerol lipase
MGWATTAGGARHFFDPFLEKGFRIIAMDLPGFGRSSGLHAYMEDVQELVNAVHAVISAVALGNRALDANGQQQRRKVYVYGVH